MENATSVFMFLTRSCNLACNHCYVSATPQLKEFMSLEVFQQAVDFFVSQGINDFRLTGGEPTIHPQIDFLLEVLNENKIKPRLITNGVRLMKMSSPQSILSKVGQCWISAYGITPQQHKMIGGKGALPLEKIVDFVGQQNRLGDWIGLSSLLTGVNLSDLKNFLISAQKAGVRNLRFLFGEPDGRAALTGTTFNYGSSSRKIAIKIVDFLRHYNIDNKFDFLSINNPFDLSNTNDLSTNSCLLSSRRMWSISPEGNIYSCCFNIYDPVHLVGNIFVSNITSIDINNLHEIYASHCKALDKNFWNAGSSCPTCPISALNMSNSSQ